MQMKMNKLMRKAIANARIVIPVQTFDLHPHLKEIIDAGFIEFEGCVFLNRLFPGPFDIREALIDDDRTGMESFINHIHIEAIVYPNPYKDVIVKKLCL
jgi:hypothetical protein